MSSWVRREGWNWVWIALLVADVLWEATAFFVHGESWDHLTISQIVKRWEGIDPATGKPSFAGWSLVRRLLVLVGLFAVAIVLSLHWVWQAF